eukprot:s683_g5.t1
MTAVVTSFILSKVEADQKLSNIENLKADIYESAENIKNDKGEELEFGLEDFVLTRGALNYKPYNTEDTLGGNKVFIHLKLRGGGKGQPVQKQSLKKKSQTVPTPTSRSAFTCTLNISSLTRATTLDGLMEQLSVTQLQKLFDNVEHGTDNIPIKIDKFAEEAPA